MNTSHIMAQVHEGVEAGRLVGAVLAVSRGGTLVAHGAAGLSDREVGTMVSTSTRFRLASLTKAVTVVGALRLVDAGRLSLSEPVSRQLPGFRPGLPDGTVPDISIHHLLTHTAGLSYSTEMATPNGLTNDRLTISTAIARIGARPLIYPPGERWEYSIATDVLGAVIARVMGRSLGDALAELVTGPLGMRSTSFGASGEVSKAYASGDPSPVVMPEDFIIRTASGDDFPASPHRAFSEASYHSGGAGLIGTAEDYLKFLEAVRTRSPILSESSWVAATTNAIGCIARRPGDQGQRFCYLGSLVEDTNLAQTVMSRGSIAWGGVYGNSWWVDPVADISAVLLSNTATEGLEGLTAANVKAAIYANA